MSAVTRVAALLMAALPFKTTAADSICYGTPSSGRLAGGAQIAKSGPNFGAYSALGITLGRTYVHSKIKRVVEQSYAALAKSQPSKTYLYGESGWAEGGRIRPHRTHQNGLAVDFMVPVMDAQGRSVALPTNIGNAYGYDIEFDPAARFEHLQIDFEALAEHLYAIHAAALNQGVKVGRVIFDPAYLPKLFKTRRGAFIKKNISFLKSRVWIRHDEHYHIDFTYPCRRLVAR